MQSLWKQLGHEGCYHFSFLSKFSLAASIAAPSRCCPCSSFRKTFVPSLWDKTHNITVPTEKYITCCKFSSSRKVLAYRKLKYDLLGRRKSSPHRGRSTEALTWVLVHSQERQLPHLGIMSPRFNAWSQPTGDTAICFISSKHT